MLLEGEVAAINRSNVRAPRVGGHEGRFSAKIGAPWRPKKICQNQEPTLMRVCAKFQLNRSRNAAVRARGAPF